MPMYGSGSTHALAGVAASLSTVTRKVSPSIERKCSVQTYPSPLRSAMSPAPPGRIGPASAGQLPATPVAVEGGAAAVWAVCAPARAQPTASGTTMRSLVVELGVRMETSRVEIWTPVGLADPSGP